MAKKKLSDSEKEATRLKLSQLETDIQYLEQRGVPVPSSLIASRNAYTSMLNTNKFNAQKTERDGLVFDSAFESKVAMVFEKNEIPYKHQVRFLIMEPFDLNYKVGVNDEKEHLLAINYNADFVIHDLIVIDVKGNKATETETFKLKWKLLKNKFRERYHYFLIGNTMELAMATAKIIRLLESKGLR